MLDIESTALIDLINSEYGGSNPAIKGHMSEVAEECENSGKTAFEVIVNYGIFTPEQLLDIMAANLGSYVWDPHMGDIPREVIDEIDHATARTHGVIPVAIDETGIYMAMRNPLDYRTVEALRFIIGKDVIPLPVAPDTFETELERYYPEKIDTVADIVAQFGEYAQEEVDEDSDDRANDAPIIKFVEVVIQQAIRDKASDIHFEPFEKTFRIRYRVDGALYEMPPPPKSLARPVTSRVKIISGLNISERRRPQDGRIQLKYNGRPVDLRVSCLPTSYGESVVLRVLDRSVVNLELDALGIGTDVLASLRDLIRLPNGIILVTGPTGSGKTTTLYSALGEINNVEDKLLTAEDPVEYDIEGIVQCPINDAVGMTFQKALRAFLRQDPDRILVGEIRDFETAQIAIEASLTGHLVFSTLHTNDAPGAITRLVDMGVKAFLVASAVRAIMAQRLLRRICKHCAQDYMPTASEKHLLGLSDEYLANHSFKKGKGCSNCGKTGYRGRIGIYEICMLDNDITELVYRNEPTQVIREAARRNGMHSLREDAMRKAEAGISTLEEVIRVTMMDED